MSVTRHKRQALLFLAAILVPAAVLVGLATRLLYQDRELAAKRAADQRHIAVDQLRRELDARLESIRLQEINRLIRTPNASQPHDSDNPAVIFTAKVDGDRALLPWEVSASEGSPAYNKLREQGELLEFGKRDNAGAAAVYRAALVAARSLSETAEAQLLLARALSKAGESAEASSLYVKLLSAPSDARDEQGVGYRFYAAERLLSAGRDHRSVADQLQAQISGPERLTLPELYMIRSLLGAHPRISERIAEMEQVVALAKDFARVRARIESGGGSAWVPYGNEPWLVAMTSPQPPLPALLLAVSSTKVAPPGAKLGTRAGDALGDEFPGLHVEWPDHRFQESFHSGLPTGIWIAGLALVLGVAALGGYLLLRDVNRDVRMNEVRSQFVASVSHELKTPLTAIRMFAETLAMGRSRDEPTRVRVLGDHRQ